MSSKDLKNFNPIEVIKTILKNRSIANCTLSEKIIIQKEIDSLYSYNMVADGLINLSFFQSSIIETKYQAQRLLFLSFIKDENNKGSSSLKCLAGLIKNSIKEILPVLEDIGYTWCVKKVLVPFNYEKLFTVSMVSLITLAGDNLMESLSSKKEVLRHQLVYRLIILLKKLLLEHILMESKASIEKQESFWKVFKLEKLPESDSVDAASFMIIDLLIRCDIVKALKEVTISKHKQIKLEINNLETESIIPFANNSMPSIVPPRKWNKKGVRKNLLGVTEELVVNIFCGSNYVSYSEDTISSLNIMQSRKYVVSETALEQFKSLETLPKSVQESVNYTSKSEMTRLYDQYDLEVNNISDDVPSEAWKKYYDIKNSLKKENCDKLLLGKEDLKTLETIQGIALSESNISLAIVKSKEAKNTLALLIRNKELQNESLEILNSIAELYKGVILYFGCKIDYRGRIYPWSWMFSRTTGHKKQYVSAWKKYKVTTTGAYPMIKSFFPGAMIEECLEWCTLKDFWGLNKHLALKKVTTMYGLCLYHSITEMFESRFKKCGYTAFLLEIDQSCSAGVFAGLILGVQSLSDRCNVSNVKPKELQAYSHLLGVIKNQVESESKENQKGIVASSAAKTEEVEPKCYLRGFANTITRNQIKSIFMTFMYSQKVKSRFEDLIAMRTEKNTLIDDKDVFLLSVRFPKYVNIAFPGLVKAIEGLNIILRFLLDHTHSIRFRTLDGTICSWVKYRPSSVYRQYWCGITNTWRNCRLNKPTKVVHIEKSMTSAFVGFIHLIDASIIRMITLDAYKYHGLILTSTHDSLQIEAESIPLVNKVIEDIYNKVKWEQVLTDSILEPNGACLSSSLQKDLSILIKVLSKSMEKIPLENFKAKVMYPLDDV